MKKHQSTDLGVGSWVFIVAMVAIGGLAMIFVFWVVPSYFEASAFNSATGKHVSTWDAMFVELRVQESAK